MAARAFADDEAVAFRREVRDWLQQVLPLGDPEEAGHEFTRRQWDHVLCEGGFAGISWPESVGGRGLGPIEEFIFHEEAAAAHAPDNLNIVGFDLAGPAIIAVGSDDQKRRFLPAILNGAEIWCEGFSEPGAGSDLANVSTFGTPVEGGYVVTGQKTWTSRARVADRCYLLARTSATAGRGRNLSVLLIEMKQPGVEVRPIRQITGDQEFGEVFFSEAYVSEQDRLGVENDGWKLATLAGFRQDRRIADGLRRYVLIKAAIDQLEHCAIHGTRGELQQLQTEVELLYWHLRRCSELVAQGRDVGRDTSVIKLTWSELWQRVSEAGLILSCPEHEEFWRRQWLYTRSVTIAGGTAQIQRNVIADRVLGMPR